LSSPSVTEETITRASSPTAVHPGVERMLVSARTGEGVEGFRDWLVRLGARREVPA
jgi:hypothetical protein